MIKDKENPNNPGGEQAEKNTLKKWIADNWLRGLIVAGTIAILGISAYGLITADANRANVVVIGILTLISLVILAINAASTSKIVDIMERQESEMTDQRRAMQDQLEVMNKQFLTDVMPVVVPVQTRLEKPIRSGEYPVAHLYVTNLGKSVGNDLRVSFGTILASGKALDEIRQGRMPPKEAGPVQTGNTRGVIAPNAPPKHFNTPKGRSYKPGHWEQLLSGDRVFYFFGELSCFDVIGNKYVTDFCFYAPDVDNPSLSYTTIHNRIRSVPQDEPGNNDAAKQQNQDEQAN